MKGYKHNLGQLRTTCGSTGHSSNGMFYSQVEGSVVTVHVFVIKMKMDISIEVHLEVIIVTVNQKKKSVVK